ncbi:hypothetical protein TNCV_3923211 [Trichonephila clavipes]|nr:hypothetical protein TNCV_3923211 [Trichonephila clavipes]
MRLGFRTSPRKPTAVNALTVYGISGECEIQTDDVGTERDVHGVLEQEGNSAYLHPPTCYTRAFGDGPRNLNHGQVTWTTPELATPLLTTTPTGGRFSSSDLTCIAALHATLLRRRSSMELGLELMSRRPRVRDHITIKQPPP